ncbi:uncharacterized protein VNE69_04079 [Vairimorpha necatrix]|uniref:Uncharacterized protein n=1 Tax=Vairimorpha necatrix TaxID=6039 RepID=A0AAX4JBE0_9MICR
MFLLLYFLICSDKIDQTEKDNLIKLTNESLTINSQKSKFNKSSDECYLPLKKRKFYVVEQETKTLTVDNTFDHKARCSNVQTFNQENYNFKKCNVSKQTINTKNYTDYKELLKNLKEQIQKWDAEDEKTESKFKVLNCVNSKEYNIYKDANRAINMRFYQFFKSINIHNNKIRRFLEYDSIFYGKINPLIENIDFIEEIIKYLGRILPKKKNYISNIYRLIDFYSVLPTRLEILKDEFKIIEKFKIFKMKFNRSFPKMNEEIKDVKKSLNSIHEKLKYFFSELNKVKENSRAITENLEKILLTNY